MDGFDYAIKYDVQAETTYEAITKATALLRSNLRLNGVLNVAPTTPGWYEVRLHVHESPVDHPAERTFESVR